MLVGHELVVEITLDGVQSSTGYAGGVALRSARVKRYRPRTPARPSMIATAGALAARAGDEFQAPGPSKEVAIERTRTWEAVSRPRSFFC